MTRHGALGSVRAVTNASGAVVRTHDYRPFGEGENPTAGTDPTRFTGKERDTESGFDYFGARYYASRSGRFTTVDPRHVEFELVQIEGIAVRVATPRMLYRMKRDTVRPQDRADAQLLKQRFDVEDN